MDLKANKRLCAAVFLFGNFAVCLSATTIAGEPTTQADRASKSSEDDIASIIAIWEQRRLENRGIRVKWDDEVVYCKGSLASSSLLGGNNSNESGFEMLPKEDTLTRWQGMLSIHGGRVELVRSGMLWASHQNTFQNGTESYSYDQGKETRMFQHDEPKARPLFLVRHTATAEDLRLLWLRPIMLALDPIEFISNSTNDLKGMNVVDQNASFQGTPCLLLSFVKERFGKDLRESSDRTLVWVDAARGCAILHLEQFAGSKPLLQITLDYASDDAGLSSMKFISTFFGGVMGMPVEKHVGRVLKTTRSFGVQDAATVQPLEGDIVHDSDARARFRVDGEGNLVLAPPPKSPAETWRNPRLAHLPLCVCFCVLAAMWCRPLVRTLAIVGTQSHFTIGLQHENC